MDETGGKRLGKRERTRARIQEVALDLFVTQGYRATTLAQVAQAADIAPRTVTLHFATKDALLFADDPFSPETLVTRICDRAGDESTFDAVRAWMAATMTRLASQAPEEQRQAWRQRARRAAVIASDDELRGAARAGYLRHERPIAEGIGRDLGLPGDGLVPRLAATTVITGLREIHETRDARPGDGPPTTAELLVLVDRVLDFASAGVKALRGDVRLTDALETGSRRKVRSGER